MSYNNTKRRTKASKKKILKRDFPTALRIIKGKARNGRGGGVLLITILRPEICYYGDFVCAYLRHSECDNAGLLLKGQFNVVFPRYLCGCDSSFEADVR